MKQEYVNYLKSMSIVSKHRNHKQDWFPLFFTQTYVKNSRSYYMWTKNQTIGKNLLHGFVHSPMMMGLVGGGSFFSSALLDQTTARL